MSGSDRSDADAPSPVNSAHSAEDVARAGHTRVPNGRGRLWAEDDDAALDRLVEEQGTSVKWRAVARYLAAEYPPATGAAQRTAGGCRSRVINCRPRQPEFRRLDLWSDAERDELKRHVTVALRRRASVGGRGALGPTEWSWIAEQMGNRTVKACQHQVFGQGWLRGRGKIKITPQSSQPSLRGGAILANTPSPTLPAASPLPRHSLSSASSSASLISHLSQPFPLADDTALLALYRELGPMHKTISRRMVPQNHKHEVRERLKYLLGGYDVEELWEDE